MIHDGLNLNFDYNTLSLLELTCYLPFVIIVFQRHIRLLCFRLLNLFVLISHRFSIWHLKWSYYFESNLCIFHITQLIDPFLFVSKRFSCIPHLNKLLKSGTFKTMDGSLIEDILQSELCIYPHQSQLGSVLEVPASAP